MINMSDEKTIEMVTKSLNAKTEQIHALQDRVNLLETGLKLSTDILINIEDRLNKVEQDIANQ